MDLRDVCTRANIYIRDACFSGNKEESVRVTIELQEVCSSSNTGLREVRSKAYIKLKEVCYTVA